MEALTLALDKKFGIYVCEDKTVVLDGSIRIPVQVHNELPDIAKLTSVVQKYGYRLVSENDGSDNLNLYLQSETVFAGDKYKFWCTVVVDTLLISLGIYMIHINIRI